MSWIYTGSVWWKLLLSEYHPDCIINQGPFCKRCNNNMKQEYFTLGKSVYNKKTKEYDKAIYCENCIFILNRRNSIYYYLLNREINGSIIYKL